MMDRKQRVTMKKSIVIWLLSGLLAVPILGQAQGPMPGGNATPGTLNPHLQSLFGKIAGFSSRLEMRVTDKSQKEIMSSTMDFALLEGKSRMDMDMTTIKSDQIQEGMTAMVKQMGMDKIITITLPEKKAMLLVYPSLKSHVEMPLSQEDQSVLGQQPKVEKTELGKETIDGHPCVKNKVILTDASGRKFDAVVWYATDLESFPLRMQFTEKDNTSTLTYKDVKLERPSADQFEVASDSTRYPSIQAMMGVVMQKMMRQQSTPPAPTGN
jgi:hypothetical protein